MSSFPSLVTIDEEYLPRERGRVFLLFPRILTALIQVSIDDHTAFNCICHFPERLLLLLLDSDHILWLKLLLLGGRI